MDPQQELFTKLLLNLRSEFKSMGYEVYDGALPPEGTKYPFVYLGDFRQSDNPTKTNVVGTVHPMIHVWNNNPMKRGTVSNMLALIKTVCGKIDHTENFSWILYNVNQRILNDNTTKTPLLHGVIEADFRFS